MLSRQYRLLTRKAIRILAISYTVFCELTYQLELNRHQTEVDHLNSRPHKIVGLESRNVHIPELVGHSTSTTTLSDSHGSVENSQTEWRKDELVESNAFHGGDESARLGNGEDTLEESEPFELHRGHAETVGHEARETLKVKGWGEADRVGDQVAFVERVLSVELVDLNSDAVVLLEAAWLAESSFADGGDGLGDCVCDASEDGVCDHHGHDCGCLLDMLCHDVVLVNMGDSKR
jgi:hypothetical protein